MTNPPRPVAGHYTVDGERLPRVTTVLSILSKPGLEKWRLRIGVEAAERISRDAAGLGTRVHAELERVNRREVFTVSPDLTPFVDAYETWLAASVMDVLAVERFLVHRRDGYAGTADVVCRLRDGRVMLVDLKTSNSLDGSYRLQTAAYADALGQMGEPVDGRLIVNLPSREPGTLRTVEHDDYERDLKAWRAALRLWRWNERHKDDWRRS